MPDDILAALRWRYAVKQFDPAKTIAPDVWAKLEQALVLSPSSYGLQPWRFVVVTDKAVRQKLLPAAWNQRQVVDASHVVVFAVKKHVDAAFVDTYVRRTAEVRGVPVESLDGFRKMMLGSIAQAGDGVDHWMSKQVYIALGVFLATAAALGVDACPMEGLEAAKFDEILGLSAKGYGSLVMATVGYRAADDKYAALPKVRFGPADVIEHV